MAESGFKRWNLILGWSVFALALLVYGITVEPTVSFWDAGEYIATSAKLQIAHPPGAPLLQMIGAFFASFATDRSQIALAVNYVSVVSSAFTILFLFWTITNLARKLISRKDKISGVQNMAILGSGFIGALAFTFSDSFWFNATETEVYSMASLIMALLLWLGLKWVHNLGSPRSDKWLILIAFVIGLTFGIQFMGFLAIPSIGLLIYFKRFEIITPKNFIIANVAAVALLLLVFKFSLTYVLKMFGWSEVFFVNTIGLPFNSGSLIMGILLATVFFLALRHTQKRNLRTANTIILVLLFLVLGFSSWLMLPIRANAKTVINENDPDNARTLLAYYNREIYPAPASPFYGAYYSDKFADDHPDKDDHPKYEKDHITGKYIVVNSYKGALRGDSPQHTGWLPRMWSSQNAENYMRYYGPLEFTVKREFQGNSDLQRAAETIRTQYADGEIDTEGYIKFLTDASDYIEVRPPTVWQNIEYLFHFQLGYMYLRYFMWNFVGRQNDEQGRFDGNGEWLSGIGFIDGLRLGNQENLPSEELDNKARNTYFFLPLLLGLVGLVFQFQKDWKQFWVLMVFFLFTGLAIQFYTNPPIFQPRERDYSLVGSFYVFAIWIGLGVYGLFEEFKKFVKPKMMLPIVLVVCFVAVPALMAQQNWDDHDRSDRYTALAMAKSYLDSTKKEAGSILFTIGDIDTFPLWYAQEIEGYRTDTRVIVTTYFNTDWYIDQMKRRAYESEPIPSQLTHDLYRYGSRDVIYYAPMTDTRWPIQDFMKWVASDSPQTKVKSLMEKQGRDISNFSDGYLDAVFYPTNKIRVPVNKDKVLATGLVKPEDADLIVDHIDIDLPETGIGKGSLLMLDIIANNDWERPIYFSGGSFDEQEYIWMSDYLQLDGLVYKLVPIKTKNTSIFEKGRIDSDLMYDIVMKWDWGNSGSPDIYHDPQTRKQGGVSNRIALARLLEKLLEENKIEKARKIIELAMVNIPLEHFGYYTFVVPFFDGYYKVGEPEKANRLFHRLKCVYQERLDYCNSVPMNEQFVQIETILADLQGYRRLIDVLEENKEREMAERETLVFNEYADLFQKVLSQY
ncbi:DUF2723 domain-containing protein [Maribacter algicola]|uniref:DUF2723 domain-containing protein n=1 Tax=Meishania litoralis TaxID=3434685 RepID=A0ACC7LLE2_9FLAO